MRGSYILLIKQPNDQFIRIGKLGTIKFNEGFYAYIGSALNGLDGRINRHLSKDKKIFWHIDYFLESSKIVEIFYIENDKHIECSIAIKFKNKMECINKFGSSDCNCSSHLFFNPKSQKIQDFIAKLGFQKY